LTDSPSIVFCHLLSLYTISYPSRNGGGRTERSEARLHQIPTGLISANEVISPYGRVLTRKQNAIDRLFRLGEHSNLGIFETPKARRQRREPTSDSSRKSSSKLENEGKDMFFINAQRSHSSSPGPISGQPSPPGSVVPCSKPRPVFRRLAEPGSPTKKRRKERTTSPDLQYCKDHHSLPLSLRPPRPHFDA
jgi:hypothetical protein